MPNDRPDGTPSSTMVKVLIHEGRSDQWHTQCQTAVPEQHLAKQLGRLELLLALRVHRVPLRLLLRGGIGRPFVPVLHVLLLARLPCSLLLLAGRLLGRLLGRLELLLASRPFLLVIAFLRPAALRLSFFFFAMIAAVSSVRGVGYFAGVFFSVRDGGVTSVSNKERGRRRNGDGAMRSDEGILGV